MTLLESAKDFVKKTDFINLHLLDYSICKICSLPFCRVSIDSEMRKCENFFVGVKFPSRGFWCI
ncbi:Uncharacterized protein APZ42_016328 [Daphnia magna]|uniref:Uncharacterized protein n=1 Tax=Daphnia magna TaxID=35525 RepID=A0A165ACR3_9CRUS|nr:Uncharacterized protein APZ42_016328 [Daphnia magna]